MDRVWIFAVLVLSAVTCTWADKAVRADNFVDTFGVNIHLHFDGGCYKEGYDVFKTLLIESGIRHIRDGMIDTTWQPYYDRLNELGRAGIKSQLIVDVHTAASVISGYPLRVLDSIERYEGPNEYDLNGNSSWAVTLKSFTQYLWQAHNTSYPVVGPSLTSETAYGSLGNQTTFVDFGNIHNYFSGFNPGTKGWGGTDSFGTYGSITWNLNIAAQVSGGKKIVSSETGYPSLTPVTAHGQIPLDIQSKYLPRIFAEHYLFGIDRTLLYQFCDYGSDGGALMGLVAVDSGNYSHLTPKPAYYTIKNLVSLLADKGGDSFATFDITLNFTGHLSNVNHLLLQKQNGEVYMLVWIEAASWDVNANGVSGIGAYVNIPSQAVNFTVLGDIDSIGSLYTFNDTTGSMSSTPITFFSTASMFNTTAWTAPLIVTDSISIVKFSPQVPPSSTTTLTPHTSVGSISALSMLLLMTLFVFLLV